MQVIHVYFNLFVYITRDFSFPLVIEMYGRPFFFEPSLHREYYRTLRYMYNVIRLIHDYTVTQ